MKWGKNGGFTKLKSNTIDLIYLQNSTYIITNGKKYKHKKALPFREEERLHNNKNSLFYVGIDNPVKEIKMNNDQIDIGVIICKEHEEFYTPNSKFLENKSPVIECIVSNSIDVNPNDLFGAVNVHMDKNFGLSVYVNDLHPKRNDIKEVKSFLYSQGDLIKSPTRKETQVIYFSNNILKETTARQTLR